MVQKLIRLTSDSGDGIFNGIFNEEVEIKEGSEVALQSLSVVRKSEEIVINSDNGVIKFSSVGATGSPLARNQQGLIIPQGKYDRGNYTELLKHIGSAMNRVCSLSTQNAEWGIQHAVEINESGYTEFKSSLSPFYQIQKPDPVTFIVNDQGPFVATNGEVLNVYAEFQTGEFGMWRESDTTTGGGGTEPLLAESYMYSNVPCIKSAGLQRTRFKRLNTNGAGTPSFTMGLVKGDTGLQKLNSGDFTIADCVYAIRVNGHNSAMQYLTGAGEAFQNTVTPVNHTTAAWTNNLNDVIDIEFGNGIVRGVITSETAGTPTRTVLDQAINHDDEEDYYFFISMHEGKANCVLDLTGVTLDPTGQVPGEERSIIPDNIAPGIIPDSAITDLPLYNDGGIAIRDGADFTPALELDKLLSSYLGFTSEIISPFKIQGPEPVEDAANNDYEQGISYSFTATKPFDNSYDSDTYIVDTQTFTLDSFDSFGLSTRLRTANSGGSRRNIIATIPITETPIVGTSDSIIQFQPATLNYIAIKNRSDITTRQIRCRLLTGQYQAVETQGLASIVLLIRDPE